MKGVGVLVLVVAYVSFGVDKGFSNGSPLPSRFPLGTIGCMFTKLICGPEEECIDDHLFGTCQRNVGPRDYYQYLLDHTTLQILQTKIWQLIQSGFTWRDKYTQCVVQNILAAYRTQGQGFDERICDSENLEDDGINNDLVSILEELFNYYSDVYAQAGGDPAALEEVPMYNQEEPDYSNLLGYDYYAGGEGGERDLSGSRKRDEILHVHKYVDPSQPLWKRRKQSPPPPLISPDFQSYLDMVSNNDGDQLDTEQSLFDNSDYIQKWSPQDWRDLQSYLEVLQLLSDDSDTDNINTEENDISNVRDNNPNPFEENLAFDTEISNQGSNDFLSEPLHNAFWPSDDLQPAPEVHSLSIQPKEASKAVVMADSQMLSEQINNEAVESESRYPGITPRYAKLLSDLLQGNLDPGKLSDNELDKLTGIVNRMLLEFQLREKDDIKNTEAEIVPPETETEDDDVVPEENSTPVEDVESLLPEKKESPSADDDNTPDEQTAAADNEEETVTQPENSNEEGEGNMAFVVFSKNLDTDDAQRFIDALEDQLNFPPGTFHILTVNGNQITFGVSPESDETATFAASAAEVHKDELEKRTGLHVEAAGVHVEQVGKAKASPKYFILTFVLCGSVAIVLVAVVGFYLVQRHKRSKNKLAQLAASGDGVEASKDYQDLCRQRMQSKASEKPEPLHAAAQRIGSTESQNRSPSGSRSSTSSWCEEPAATNMDISTGHIVLSYMEDHLKNKDRLDQEWQALCAYEADPASTNMACDTANVRKNRYADVLPYDHSRVILTDATNVSHSDYVNASTITDHDPRNPAYIVSQGPLPHTVADFWQMVWEQGSVVIVALTKLTENGVAMCHRYWPEEGSDLYHIYEVHLVSEHIWCDDYLVRSFYLKNLQTNETRTVTQFHFLTWMDNKVPESVKALLDFRRKVNKSYRGRSCPIVVHCSDGCGRSGTYTLIDMVLNRLAKGAKEIDIAATLEHIRDQRMSMAKTKEQFEFVLAAVAEEVHAILKALPQ